MLASQSREAALDATQRIPINTPRIKGSISLTGGRVDDVSLAKYRETVDPNSPMIVLLSPDGSPHPFYAEFGWVAAPGTNVKLPGPQTVWQQQGEGALTPAHPVTLVYDNGAGLTFSRTISVDENYLFTLKDGVANNGPNAIALYPCAMVSRQGAPQVVGFYFLHEGLIGEFGDKGEQQVTYKSIDDKKVIKYDATNTWMGITDKYWAAVLLPEPDAHIQAEFSENTVGNAKVYDTLYVLDQQVIPPGGMGAATQRLFAGAKEFHVVENYWHQLDLNHFDLLIDWWTVYFISKPLFRLLDLIFQLDRKFRRRDPDRHRADQDRVLPPGQQILCLHGEDEGGPAADAGAARALS